MKKLATIKTEILDEVSYAFRDTFKVIGLDIELDSWIGKDEIVCYKASARDINIKVVVKHDNKKYSLMRFFPVSNSKWSVSVDINCGTLENIVEFML